LTGILARATVASAPPHGVYYYINDHLGTPQAVVDEQGQIVWQAEYLPFGEAKVLIETFTNDFRLPGQYHDEETGLHYNYYRYYYPKKGKYVTPDPIGLFGGLHLYAYTANNPIDSSDPFGLTSFLEFRYRSIVKCIDKFGSEISQCHQLCDEIEKGVCELRANLNFEDCVKSFWKSVDTNRDGKVDKWDELEWFFMRRLWDLITPPGTIYPPGLADEGPGSTDRRLLPDLIS
jgi:RHS repeat-associated protein